jgi:pimeloyl-ACP methyl ester carboxylesterase
MPETALTGSISGPVGRLHVDDGGRGGLPVVFIHGFGGTGLDWLGQLDHVRRSRRGIALDLRGHGESDAPADPADYEVDAIAEDVAALMDELELDRVVLVGHSLGGAVSIAYAGAHPERVAGLVLEGAPGRTPDEQADQAISAMTLDYAQTSEMYYKRLLTGARPEVERQVRRDAERMPREDGLAIIRSTFAFDPLPALDRYQGPKLIIDPESGDSPGFLHNLAPSIPRQVVGGTSHWVQMDRPDEFNRLLDRFLAAAT